MRFDIITIFPRMFGSPLSETIIKRAQEKGIVQFHLHDIRDHAQDKHRCVDDTPYCGERAAHAKQLEGFTHAAGSAFYT
jgi:tRNA (guanine37-N1)-methyltransferase